MTQLCDGEQSPGCSMNLAEKIRMARQFENLGADIIEAGFPVASEGDFQAVRAISETCETATVAALCRTTELDIARVSEALKSAKNKRIHTFVATSDIHLEYKLRKTRTQVLEMTRNAVRLAKNQADEIGDLAAEYAVEFDDR